MASLFDAIGGRKVSEITVGKYSTGIKLLDTFAGGGFPDGGWCLIVGDAGSGKSTLVLQIAGNIQKQYDDVDIIIVDTEKSIRADRTQALGLDPNRVIYWLRKDGKPITIEAVFNELIHDIITYKVKNRDANRTIIIWDSIALTPAEGELEDIANQTTLQAVALTKALKGYFQQLVDYKILVLAINHYRDTIKMGPFQTKGVNELPKLRGTIPGGNQQIYAAQHLLELTTQRVFNEKDIKKFGYHGAYVQGQFIKNKFITPFNPFTLILSTATGFDDLMTRAELLVKGKVLQQKGAYLAMPGYDKTFYFKDIPKLYSTDEKFKTIFDKISDAVLKKIEEELRKGYNAPTVESGVDKSEEVDSAYDEDFLD